MLGVERGDASGVPLRQRRHAARQSEGQAVSIISVLLTGVIGIVSEPARCPPLYSREQPLALDPTDQVSPTCNASLASWVWLSTGSDQETPWRRGYDEGGAPGLVTGAYRGFMGALVKPLAYMLETSARVADNITAMVVGVPEIVPRVRPPRFVSAVQPLPSYDWSEVIPSTSPICLLRVCCSSGVARLLP